MSSPKTAIRAGSLKSIGTGRGGIAAAESHAKRLDPVAKGRVVHPSDPIAWSKAEAGPLDYVEAFKAHKRETGAGERKGASLAMEFKAVVSPDWLAETGDPRAAANPRVRQLVTEAKAWAESWGGAGAVWAVRYDTDEKGAGVVDLFMSPVRQQQHKGGTSKAVISTRKAKEELLAAEQAFDPGLKTSGAAMQSSWARWCQQKLDARLERGQSKEQTGRDHIHADVYAKVAQEARREALRDAQSAYEASMAQGKAEGLREGLEALQRAREAAQALAGGNIQISGLTPLAMEIRELAQNAQQTVEWEVSNRSRYSSDAPRKSDEWRAALERYQQQISEDDWKDLYLEIKGAHEAGKAALDDLPRQTSGSLVDRILTITRGIAAYWNGLAQTVRENLGQRMPNKTIMLGVLDVTLPYPLSEYQYLQPMMKEAETEVRVLDLTERLAQRHSGP